MENIVELLKPFAIYTQLASSEDTTSISMVVPIIMELRLHLEQMKNVHGLCLVSCNMLEDMERRFGFMLNPTEANFDPLFITSTFLSPTYRELLSNEQVAAARSNLLKQMSPNQQIEKEVEPDSNEVDSNLGTADPSKEPSPKKFRNLMELLKEKQRAKEISCSGSQSDEEIELEKYASCFQMDEDEDPIAFWHENAIMYPLLSNVAFDLLSTPASTAPVERVFSTGGEVTTGKRNRLTASNLERQIFLTQNKRYLHLI